MVNNRMPNPPTGVKVISIIYYLLAAMAILGGVLALAGSAAGAALINYWAWPDYLFAGAAAAAIVGVLAIVFGILFIILGVALWRLKNWARITVIILASLNFLGALLALIGGNVISVVSLLIHGWIVWYLAFSDAKLAFY